MGGLYCNGGIQKNSHAVQNSVHRTADSDETQANAMAIGSV